MKRASWIAGSRASRPWACRPRPLPWGVGQGPHRPRGEAAVRAADHGRGEPGGGEGDRALPPCGCEGAKVALARRRRPQVKAATVVIRFDPRSWSEPRGRERVHATADERLTSKRVQQNGSSRTSTGTPTWPARARLRSQVPEQGRGDLLPAGSSPRPSTRSWPAIARSTPEGAGDPRPAGEGGDVAAGRRPQEGRPQDRPGADRPQGAGGDGPHDGLFVLKREWGDIVRVGETVWPGQPVAEIPDLQDEGEDLRAGGRCRGPGARAQGLGHRGLARGRAGRRR